MGNLDNDEGHLFQPYGLAVASDGTVYVADTDNHHIQQFTAGGGVPERVGQRGQRRGAVR